MAIKKQEFYEGAALHRLICFGGLSSVSFEDPFFLLNNKTFVYLKYSTKNRSPWNFTFASTELGLLKNKSEIKGNRVVVGLVCGFDGIAMVRCLEMQKLGIAKDSSIHIACFRKHGEHYEVCGPEGKLSNKVAPSDWTRLLTEL